MIISKISRTTKRVKIVYSINATKKSAPEEHELSCREMPKPSFDKALADLIPHVQDICALGDVEAKRFTVKGVSLKRKDDVLYASICASITSGGAPGPFTLNTPVLPEESEDSFKLSSKCATALEKLVQEAAAYVKGDRMQGVLLEPDAGKEKDKDEGEELL